MQELIDELKELASNWQHKQDTGSLIEDRGFNRAKALCAHQLLGALEQYETKKDNDIQ